MGSSLLIVHVLNMTFARDHDNYLSEDNNNNTEVFFVILFLPPANKVWGKVIFSQACVIPSVHRVRGVVVGGWGFNWGERKHPGGSASRSGRDLHPGVGGVCIQGWEGSASRGLGRPPVALQDIANKRVVRILLQCIPVEFEYWPLFSPSIPKATNNTVSH